MHQIKNMIWALRSAGSFQYCLYFQLGQLDFCGYITVYCFKVQNKFEVECIESTLIPTSNTIPQGSIHLPPCIVFNNDLLPKYNSSKVNMYLKIVIPWASVYVDIAVACICSQMMIAMGMLTTMYCFKKKTVLI